MATEEISNIKSESGIIATLIHNPSFVFHSEELLPNHFTNRQNACLYLAISNLVQQNIETIDAYNIINSLEAAEATRRYADELKVDEIQEFIEMSDSIARRTLAEYKLDVEIVMKCALRRDVLKRLRKCEAMCNNLNEENLEQKIYAALDDVMMEFSSTSEVPPYAEIVDECWEQVKSRQGDGFSGYPFKFPTLNQYATLERGELFIFAA